VGKYLLMGGLGNQLFQLAAGLELTEEKLELISDLGNPRTNSDGSPELHSFSLPKRVIFVKTGTFPYLLRKLCNFGIRLGARSKPNSPRLRLYENIVSLTFLSHNRYSLRPHFSAGVGVDREFRDKDSRIHIGYFQGAQYCQMPRTRNEQMGLDIRNPSDLYKSLNRVASAVKPIVLHVRLGDYLSENSFGVPSRKYYENALKILNPINEGTPVWIFSNEPTKVIEFLSLDKNLNTFLVPNDGLSSAETLSLMRKGSGYIIGNSSFSWWGAMLSFTDNAQVVMPTPWFKNGKIPVGIYPPSWRQVAASYDYISERVE